MDARAIIHKAVAKACDTQTREHDLNERFKVSIRRCYKHDQICYGPCITRRRKVRAFSWDSWLYGERSSDDIRRGNSGAWGTKMV
jgi:hypothetical protein